MLKREGLLAPIWILTGCLLLLLAAGTRWDYALSRLLYPGYPSTAGLILAAVGELPAFFFMISGGAVLIRHRGKSTRFKDIFFLLGGIALILFGSCLTFLELHEDLPLAVADLLALTAGFILLCLAAGLAITRHATRDDCLRYVLSVLLVCCLTAFLANLVKGVWARPRMWYLIQTGDKFQPWYMFGSPSKAAWLAAGGDRDAFRSCPSGHVTTAAASILFLLLPTLHPRFEGRGKYLLVFSILWTGIIALSRIVMGTHFLTDTVLAWLYVLVHFLLSQRLFYRDGRLFRLLHRLMT